MINISNEFIEQISEAGKMKNCYISYDNKEIKPEIAKLSFQGSLFKTIMRQLELEIKDNENIIDKKVNFKYGLYINNEFEYINYGTFEVTKCEDIIKENKIKATAYDNMVKFMIKYNKDHLNLTYPHTLLQLVQAICSYLNVELYSTNFYNADLMIEEDLFTALNCTYRDILDYICQVTLTTAIIKDDKLYFKTIEDVSNRITIGPDILKTLTMKSGFGPCNSLVLGRGDLNDNIYSKDDNSIALYGLQEIKFDNNEIIDKRREEVIDGMFQQIKGMEYNTFEATDLGTGFFEGADMIKVQDTQENEYLVLILSGSITITSGTVGTMESDILSESTTNYSYSTDSQKRQTRTEAIVNKQENKITLVSQEIKENSGLTSELALVIGQIQSSVLEIEENQEEKINKLLQDSSALSVAISKVGGNNLIKNSAMLNETNFWLNEIRAAYEEGPTPPASPVENEYWYCTNNIENYVADTMYKYENGEWIVSNVTRKELSNTQNLLIHTSANDYFEDGTRAADKTTSGRVIRFGEPKGIEDYSITQIFNATSPVAVNQNEKYLTLSFYLKNSIKTGVASIGLMFLPQEELEFVETLYSIYEPSILITPDDFKELTKLELKVKIPTKDDFLHGIVSETAPTDTTKVWLDTSIYMLKTYNSETSQWEISNTLMSFYDEDTGEIWTYRAVYGFYYKTPVKFEQIEIKTVLAVFNFFPSMSVYTGNTEPTLYKGLYWNNQTTDLVQRAKYGPKEINNVEENIEVLEESTEPEEPIEPDVRIDEFKEWETLEISSTELPTGVSLGISGFQGYVVPISGYFEVSDLKLEYNSVGTLWTQYPGELYAKNYKMDEKGFSIQSGSNTMFIDEDEIIATYKNLNIFQINKDLAYFNKILVNESLQVGIFMLKEQLINNKRTLLLH